MRKRWIAAAAALAVGLGATAAAAQSEITAFGTAEDGDLLVASSVIFLPKSAEMRGGWLDESVPCIAQHSLRVRIEIFWSKGNQTKRKIATKTRLVDNCAEGGPNVGFAVNAKASGFACPNGKWRPGTYSFNTRTTDLTAGGLNADASLILTKGGTC
jgi:hypothetical protein